MPRKVLQKLTDAAIRSKKGDGRLGDGDGLSLVTKGTARSWVFTYGPANRRVGLTLGRYDLGMSLSIARDRAREEREKLAKGIDPREARKASKLAQAAKQTFGEFADAWLPGHLDGIKNAKDRANRSACMSDTHIPGLRKVEVGAVAVSDIVAALRVRWKKTPSTAEKMLGVIRKCLDAAIARKLHAGPNPALWGATLKDDEVGLGPLGKEKSVTVRNEVGAIVRDSATGAPVRTRTKRGNMAMIRPGDMPDFYAALCERDADSAVALRFIILTGARTNEVRTARWEHIDFAKAVWSRPAELMKAGEAHNVPLSPAALELLQNRYEKRRGGLIFPATGPDPEKQFSENAITTLVRLRMKRPDVTPHGMRAALRTWLTNETDCPFVIAEQCLAHGVGNETTRAYNRGDSLARRRIYMDRWAAVVTQSKSVSIGELRFHG